VRGLGARVESGPQGSPFAWLRPQFTSDALQAVQPLEKECFRMSNPWIFQGLEKLLAGKGWLIF
jgi:hypothetical protein